MSAVLERRGAEELRAGIYIITNTLSGKSYIGSSVNVGARLAQHKRALRGGYHDNTKLNRSWFKHGSAHFIFAVVELTDREDELVGLEQKWIDGLGCVGESGFNLCPAAGSCAGFKHSPETLAKRKGFRPWNKGLSGYRLRPKTPEQRRKIGDAQRGSRNHNYGKRIPESVKQKCRESYRGAQCHLAKLDDDRVRQIKLELSRGVRGADLARRYGVARTQISAIKKGKTWKHVVLDQ